MAGSFISDNTLKILEKSLDISASRHRLIANNSAKIHTVGFTPKDLDFKKALKEAMENKTGRLSRTHPKHIKHHLDRKITGNIQENYEIKQGLGPVNIDREMINMVENNIKYRTSVEMLLRKMGMLKQAIAEGGR